MRPYHHLEYVPLAGVTGVRTIIVMAELEPLVWNSLFSQTHTYKVMFSTQSKRKTAIPQSGWVGVSPHELYAAESRRIFTPLFPECNPFNVRNNRDTFLEVGEKLWLRRVYGVLMAFSLGNRALAIFCFLLGISHWYNSPLKCVCQGVFLKVMSGESILRPDSKLFCCFLIKTIKYCVYLDVFARNTRFCWKKQNFGFYENRSENRAQDVFFSSKVNVFRVCGTRKQCFHFFEKHGITLLCCIQNSKII